MTKGLIRRPLDQTPRYGIKGSIKGSIQASIKGAGLLLAQFCSFLVRFLPIATCLFDDALGFLARDAVFALKIADFVRLIPRDARPVDRSCLPRLLLSST